MEEKEPPQPATHTPQEILSADSIQNIDTARMALRWALERMHKLEQEKGSLADQAAQSERDKSRAQEEYAAIQRTLSLRSADADQRELYYAKMEEFLSLQLGGKLDLAGLGKREVEVQRLQELLSQKEVQLNKELAAKRAALDREVQRLKTELETDARQKNRQCEQAWDLKRSSLEAEYLQRMAEAHEKEILIKQESNALTERQAHFEEHYTTQRLQLQSAIKNFKAEVEDQVEFRLQISEKILGERFTGLEAAWQQEKLLMGRELESWRGKAQELGPKVIAVEQLLAMTEERLRQAQSAADRGALMLEEHRRDAVAESTALEVEANRWKEKAAEQLSEILDMKERCGVLEEGMRQMKALAQAQAARFDEAQKTAQAEQTAMSSETASWRQKFEDALVAAREDARKAAAADEALAQGRRALELQTAAFAEREAAWDEERKVLLAELAEWKDRLGESQDAAAGFEARLSQGEGAMKRAEAELKAARDERAKLEDELTAARQRAQDALPRLIALEKGLTTAEESENSMERLLARLEMQKSSWQAERARFMAELDQDREEAARVLPKILDLERRLAYTEEALAQARASGDRQAEAFAERARAWERERAELLARLKPNP